MFIRPALLSSASSFVEAPPPDYTVAPSSGFQPVASSSRTGHPPDFIAPILSHEGHLPHLVSSREILDPRKAGAHLALAEMVVFLRPPGMTTLRGHDDLDELAQGRGAKISGFFNVSTPQRRLVEGIRIEFVAKQRLAFPGEDGIWEDDEVFRKEVFLGPAKGGDTSSKGKGKSEGLWLEKGINTFEFAIAIPSTTPVYERCPYGRVTHQVIATVIGSGGLFKSDLSDWREPTVFVVPPADDDVLQFSEHLENFTEQFGPWSIDISSNEFIIAAPLYFNLSFSSPPPSLTIYAINAYVQQTISLASFRNPDKTAKIKGPRRWIIREGAQSGYSQPDFVAKSWANPEENILFNGAKNGEDAFWKWEKIARLPNDNLIRSTTLPGTQTSIRFSSELAVEVVFSTAEVPNEVRIGTFYRKPVLISSCWCMLKFLTLPDYEDKDEQNGEGCISPHDWVKLETQDPRKDGICLCCVDWATLEKRELDLMRNGQRGDEEADWIAFRRRGGGTPDEERSRSRERKATELYAVVGEDAERKALQARSPSRGTPVRR